MQQTNKPTYDQPSYEGLYYLSINHDGSTSDGYVERLLPNGEYIVTYLHVGDIDCETREMNISKQSLELGTRFFLTRNGMARERNAIRSERHDREREEAATTKRRRVKRVPKY